MVFEIRRVNFINKGAELMLYAMVAEIRKRQSDAEIVMIPDSSDSYCRRGELCIKQKAWLQRYGIQWGNITTIIPSQIRKKYGVYIDSEIDVVFDAAGFAYGDQWPISKLKEAAESSARWKKRGAKLILLPQAFGPFSDRVRRLFAKKLVLNAELVFAREVASYQHLTDLVGHYPHIGIAPDFTNLIVGHVPDYYDIESNRFCVIPNYRMVDKTNSSVSVQYIDLMVLIVEYLQSKNAKPFFLIHEGANDVWIAERINERLGQQVNVVVEKHALSIKGIIGQSDGVISSRFHGIVSALSQGVPALGTSWSHKYEMLFQDYGFPEGIINMTLSANELRAKIDHIMDYPSRKQVCDTIRKHATQHKHAARQMWDKVFSAITGPG